MNNFNEYNIFEITSVARFDFYIFNENYNFPISIQLAFPLLN